MGCRWVWQATGQAAPRPTTYVLVAIVKKRLGVPGDLCTFLQVLSLTLFEKTPIISVFSETDRANAQNNSFNQLNLFN